MLLPIRSRHALVAVLLVLAGGVAVSAQDPPSRVARLNYLSGQVSLRPASLEDWGTADINYPLSAGDHLWTERGARAEMHLGPSVIRLAPETAFAFLDLADDIVQARVAEGSIYVRVRELAPRETYEIDTPNAAISIIRPGVYRIDVEPDGSVTRVTVRSGLVEVTGVDRAFSVAAGDSAEIGGTEEMTYEISPAWSPDAWERWCRERDAREDNRVALRYVSSSMVGYEDLDDYGTWSYEPEYGYAWTPTVVAIDWAPYRYGRWSWVRPWGWTWVDDARWGFAPFHYGRWAHHHGHWLWVPGRYVARPVWAPAIVGFVGGLDWSYTFNLGPRPAVGWFPLAPGEIYCPSYRASPVYVHNLNAAHATITNFNAATYDVARARYANRAVAGAVTAVPRDVFIGAQPVQRAGVAVPRASVDRAPVSGHAIAVPPGARSIIARSGPAIARPSAAATRRAVVARTEPPSQALHDTPVVIALDGRARARGAARPAPSGAQPALASGGADLETSTARPRGVADDNVMPDVSRPAGSRDNGSTVRPGDTVRRGGQPAAADSGIWRPARGREANAPTPGAAAAETRDERGSGNERPAARYQRVAEPPQSQPPRYEHQAEPERAAARADRPSASEDRPARGREAEVTRESSPAARSRGETPRAEAPKDRPSPGSADRPSSPPPSTAPAARAPERGGERRPPATSTGRGGQSSQGSARSRGRG